MDEQQAENGHKQLSIMFYMRNITVILHLFCKFSMGSDVL